MAKVQRFLDDDDESWTVRELAERLFTTPQVVRQQLRQLLDDGRITERRDGDRWVYQRRDPKE